MLLHQLFTTSWRKMQRVCSATSIQFLTYEFNINESRIGPGKRIAERLLGSCINGMRLRVGGESTTHATTTMETTCSIHAYNWLSPVRKPRQRVTAAYEETATRAGEQGMAHLFCFLRKVADASELPSLAKLTEHGGLGPSEIQLPYAASIVRI